MKTKATLKYMLIILFLIACSNSQDKDIPPTDISLTITKETEQDQMANFAQNAMAEFNGKVWSVGGESSYVPPGTLSPTVWSSENGVAWISGVSSPVFERRDHSLIVLDDAMYLIGGFNNDHVGINDVWKTFDGINWTRLITESDFPLVIGGEHRSVIFNDQILLAKGASIDGEEVVQVLTSSNGINWSRLTSNAFPYREDFDLVVFNNELYAVGGQTTDTTLSNDIYKSSDGITWSKVNTNTPLFSGRQFNTITVYNNKVWIIGGQNSTTLAFTDIWYSSDMVNWTLYGGLEEDALGLYNHAALNYKDGIWLFGGMLQTAPSADSVNITGQIVSIKED
ncbi:Kelch repeat-containing protein [Tenacibaculum xiamenense]|uniref:hypothetical protein n=1 Tax=Tenacibaculum xiamenense TaxID=1261553 RepID=UPI003893EEFA